MNKDYSYYNEENIKNFEHLPRISTYNHNYYAGLGKDLLFAKSDDDASTYWYIVCGISQPVYIGSSTISYGKPERIEFGTQLPT